jgi:hypothetical protein
MTNENEITNTTPPPPKPLPQTYTVSLGELERMMKMLSSGYKAMIASCSHEEQKARIEEREAGIAERRERYKDLSRRAKKVHEAVPEVKPRPARDMYDSLGEQALLLDALFRQILTDTEQDGGLTEQGGINAALRAQNQYLRTLQTLDKPPSRPRLDRERGRTY